MYVRGTSCDVTCVSCLDNKTPNTIIFFVCRDGKKGRALYSLHRGPRACTNIFLANKENDVSLYLCG